MRHTVVFYNPRAVFHTLPLALVALGSRLDRSRFDVRIVDARLETDPIGRLLDEADGALCVGMTVLTGAPIRDALQATSALRRRYPALPIVWGGWHPSLFPAMTAVEAGIDAVVVGQGEDTCAEIVDRLAAGLPLGGVPGCVLPPGDASNGVAEAPARLVRDVNEWPSHDFDLIPVERYFALKGRRQFDYISSIGCRFRCAFCADPHVYGRQWFGYEPRRIAEELDRWWRGYGFEDVAFQDETFFTSARRVADVAEALSVRGPRFTWTATLRADQGARLDDGLLAMCKRAGLRRVMIGVEAGSQPMLDWMKKDVTLEQVHQTADRCRRAGVKALFNLIVGFPHESEASVRATLAVGRTLRAMSPGFEVAVFYYKPYPGTSIEREPARSACAPATLEEWASFDFVGVPGAGLARPTRRLVEGFKFYQRIGWGRQTLLRAPVQALARWRCRQEWYGLPIERTVAEWWRPSPELS